MYRILISLIRNPLPRLTNDDSSGAGFHNVKCSAFLALTLWAAVGTLANANGGNTPLASDEIQVAAELARAAMVRQRALDASANAKVINVETLTATKSNRNRGRKAIVQIYDYDNDRVLTSSVNLLNNKVSRAVVNSRVQPPLANSERKKAIQIALADAQVMNTVSRVYQRITGNPLTNINSQLNITPRNFHGSEVRNDEGPDIGNCQRQRCVQLAIVTSDSVQVNVVPVINLSEESLVTLLRVGPSENLARRMNKKARERRKERADRNAQRRMEERESESGQ